MQRNSLTNNGNTSYYAYDGRGSVSEVLSSSGSAQMRYQYNAFGETTIRYNAYVDNPYRYNAEYTDYVPGVPDMQYLRARYYAPHEGRFFAQDTLFGDTMRPLTQNLYAYCSNNAVMNIDPSGNCEVDLGIRMGGDAAVESYLRGKPCRCGTKPVSYPPTVTPKPSNPPAPTGGGSNGSSSGSGGSDEGSFSSPTQEDAMRQAEEARRRREAEEAARRKRYENGQMGLIEKTYFDQLNKPIAPKPEKVGYLAYGANGITQDSNGGFFAVYDKPTLSGNNTVYNTGELYGKYNQESYGALQGFGGGQSILNKTEFKSTSEEYKKLYGGQSYDPIKGTLVYDDIEHYGIALGPVLQNPEFDTSTNKISVKDMAYGTCVDISIQLDGETYYIPAIIVDVKAHTAPTGVFQTGATFNGNVAPSNSKNNIVEWYTHQNSNGKNKSAGLNKFNNNTNIIIYNDERMYY